MHNQTVRQSDSVRLHGVTGNVGIVTNVGVVKVGHLLGCLVEGN